MEKRGRGWKREVRVERRDERSRVERRDERLRVDRGQR